LISLKAQSIIFSFQKQGLTNLHVNAK